MIGTLPDKVLAALLETVPIEFSVLDADDKVLAWNKHGTRLFRRPESIVGRDVRNCHPKKSLDKVEKIISEMKEDKRDKARFWIEIPAVASGAKQRILIEYYALRDEKGEYLGCLEATQNITGIQDLSGEQRLL